MAVCACLVVVQPARAAAAPSGANCPYQNGIPAAPTCGVNASPSAVPAGAAMSKTNCGNAVTSAISALYVYDDAACHQSSATLTGVGGHDLVYIGNAEDSLPPNYKINVSHRSNFKALLYCDRAANMLLLAYRGSASIIPFDRNALDDWFNNNVLQTIGDRPLQYQAAEDVAYLIKKDWGAGQFDGRCGKGRPAFRLTGHSKGGGEAQFAAVRNTLDAFVFNAAPVNPVAFSDWTLMPEASEIVRRVQAVRACGGWTPADAANYTPYFATGHIHDVRMVNDPLTHYLFPICGNLLPHAPIEWLANTLMCSGNGHSIETVVREVHACER